MTLSIIPYEGKRPFPPRVTPLTVDFWQPLRDGVWQSTACRNCDQLTFPPKKICPFCWSDDMEWRPLAAEGRLYSWTKGHAAPAAFRAQAPYYVGIVDLSDGVRLACPVLPSEEQLPSCGSSVKMVVLGAEDGPLFAAEISE